MAEIFPSAFRGFGISLVTFIGRIGYILAPYIGNLLSSKDIMPY